MDGNGTAVEAPRDDDVTDSEFHSIGSRVSRPSVCISVPVSGNIWQAVKPTIHRGRDGGLE